MIGGMFRTITAAAIAAAAIAIGSAATAAADTTSFGSFGNDTLGGSAGPNGGSVSVGGVTTTVDGINTLNGSTSISGYGYSSTVNQSYSLAGTETNWTGTTPTQTFTGDGEIYYNGEVEGTFTGLGRTVVCDPICHYVTA